MKEILLYLWQLPQNLIGLLFYICLLPHKQKTDYKNRYVIISDKMRGGISLGKYIYLSRYCGYTPNDTWNHEYGHTIQSLYLGPLYLFVIGIPSVTWAWLYGTLITRTKNGYYKFYTEKWADKLGNVIRN